jgi:nucleoside-diphosphate-sugar epimerase
MNGLKGKNVLVTGGSSGIGQAIAVRFGQEGANVAINYLNILDEARQTEDMIRAVEHCACQVRDCGVQIALVQADVSKEEDVDRMMQEAIDELGGLDILINNAGIQIPGDSHENGIGAFDKVISVNLRGAYMCARAAIRHFLSENKQGVVVNVSSVQTPFHRLLGQQRRHAEPYAHAGARIRRTRHPRQRRRAGGDRHAHQPRLDRRSREARHGRQPHPDGTGRHLRRDGRRDGVSVLGRGGLRHRADALRRRRADALSRLPHRLVVGING